MINYVVACRDGQNDTKIKYQGTVEVMKGVSPRMGLRNWLNSRHLTVEPIAFYESTTRTTPPTKEHICWIREK